MRTLILFIACLSISRPGFSQTEEEAMLKKLDDTLAKDPKNADLLFMRAMGHAEFKRYNKAIADFTAALRYLNEFKKSGKQKNWFNENPIDTLAILHSRSYCYKEADSTESAVADYRILQRLKPHDFFYSIAVAHVYIEHKKFDKAQAEIKNINKAKENNERALVYQAIVYYEAEKYEQALRAANIALQKHSGSIEGLLTKAKILIKLNRAPESCKYLDEGLQKLNPEYFGGEEGYQRDFEGMLNELKKQHCQ